MHDVKIIIIKARHVQITGQDNVLQGDFKLYSSISYPW